MAPVRRQSKTTFPCITCSGDVLDNQQGLLCTMCENWCHAKCPNGTVNIKSTTLNSHRDEPDQPWFCSECLKMLPTALKAFREFSAYKEEIEKYRQSTDAALASLTDQITNLKASISNTITPAPSHPVPGPSPMSSVDIQAELREALERESKKLNLVLVGLKESDVDSVRREGDTDFVNEFCDIIGVPRGDVIDIFRSGRLPEVAVVAADGQDRVPCRVTKVKFSSASSRKKFLEKFMEKRPASAESAYVRQDMTYRERQADKALRNELFARRRVDPSGDWVINRGAIVQRRVRVAAMSG